jgi:isopropylmalate/homocitrate/citramalate synthase
MKLCKNNKQFFLYYKKIGEPRPFDVSLRDGLQSIQSDKNASIIAYDLIKKQKLYNSIYVTHYPKNIEVGSIVSKSVLPILADSLQLFEHVEDYIKYSQEYELHPYNYLLIPNSKKLESVIKHPLITNLSFITSVSDRFQQKNTKKTLEETRADIHNMIFMLNNEKPNNYRIKLYISCINQCPLDGKLDNDYIVHEILKYSNLNIDSFCLSDTCGTLELEDFEYIVDSCNFFGVPFTKMALHLHVKPERTHIVKQIIHLALSKKITNFDVSILETGGCSVTMDKKTLAPNLSYNLYYESLVDYIEKKIN